MNKKLKISFCTVCMNRSYHLKRTLLQNISDNISYRNVEFVVLDYNSNDGLEEWIADEMIEYLNSHILVYVKTDKPQYFHRSHSKNIAAKYASGDIICNVDADNYIGKGFAVFVNQQFIKNRNSYLAVQRNSRMKDCYGRICTWKKDFIKITGYDESMSNYGFEDFDFLNRLDILGRKALYITNHKYLKIIEHEDARRIENESHFHNIGLIYLRYINYYSTELLYLFKNGTFYSGVVLNNRLVNSTSIDNIFQENRKYEYVNDLQDNAWKKGNWSKKDFGLNFKFESGKENDLIQAKKGQIYDGKAIEKTFHQCSKPEIFEELVMFLSQISNRIIMLRNKDEKRIRVNEVFGEIDTT